MKSKKKTIGIILMASISLIFNGIFVIAESDIKLKEQEMKAIYGEDIIADRIPDIVNDVTTDYLIPMDVYFSDEWQAQLAYNRILESFGQHAMRLTEENDLSKYTKPDYGNSYAGAYIGEDDHLVVLIAHPEGSKEYEQACTSIMEAATPKDIGFTPQITFKSVEHSYTKLLSIMDEVILDKQSYGAKSESLWNQVHSVGVNHVENRVNLHVDPEKVMMNKSFMVQNDISKISNQWEDAIGFVLTPIVKEEIAEEIAVKNISSTNSIQSLNPGMQIRPSASIYGSMGYRAKSISGGTTEYGFVTAGHVLTFSGQVAYTGDMLDIGLTRRSQNSGNIDAAFVRADNPNYTPSNQTVNGVTLSSSYITPAVMVSIEAASHQHPVASGVIHEYPYRFISNYGTYMDGMIRVYLDRSGYQGMMPGDSGTVVYRQTAPRAIVGILKAVDGEYCAVVPATTIAQSWSVVPY